MKTNFKIQSTLLDVVKQVWNTVSLNESKQTIMDYLNNESKIKDADKVKMKTALSEITSKSRLDMYLANAVLKYEGMGVV